MSFRSNLVQIHSSCQPSAPKSTFLSFTMDPDCSIIDGSDFSSTTDQKMMNNEAERETEQTSSNPKKRPHSPSVHTSNKRGKHNDHSHPNSSRLDLHQHQTDDLIDVRRHKISYPDFLNTSSITIYKSPKN